MIATFAKYPNFIQMPINLEYWMIATFSKYAKFIQMPINFEHFTIATFAKYALEGEKETVLCVFLGASVMGDLMSLHAEMSQSSVSTYLFHSFHKTFISGQQS